MLVVAARHPHPLPAGVSIKVMGTVEFPGIGEAPDVVPWRDGADLLLQQLSRHKPIDRV